MSLERDQNEDANLVPHSVAKDVKESLDLGRVPPIFHAYCARFFVDYDSRKKDATDATDDEDATEWDEEAISTDDQKLGSRKQNDRETMISPGSLDGCTKEELKNMQTSLGFKVGGNNQELIDRITGATASAGPHGVAAAGGICGAAGIPLNSSKKEFVDYDSRDSATKDVDASPSDQKTGRKRKVRETMKIGGLEPDRITGTTASAGPPPGVVAAGGICGAAAAGIPLNSSVAPRRKAPPGEVDGKRYSAARPHQVAPVRPGEAPLPHPGRTPSNQPPRTN
jgi:hypothetical protein